MPNSANSNSGSTDTTSAAAAEHRADEASKAGSEAEYLAQQAAAARAAMRGVIDDLQANARTRWEQATDVRAWIDRHPWIAVGAASAAGFATAAAVTPAPGQSLGDKLSSTFEAVRSKAESANGQPKPDEPPRASRHASHASIWGLLLEPVIEVFKVAAQNYFAAYVAGQAAAQACSPDGDQSASDEAASAPSGSASSAESTETNASAMA